MYKNWRIGRIAERNPAKNPASMMVKIDVLEKCYDNGGEEYVAKYQINLLVNKDSMMKTVRSLPIGSPVLVGFYFQSYDPACNGVGYTVLAMKAIEPLSADEMELLATSIWGNQRDPVSYVDPEYSTGEEEEYSN